MGDTNTPDFLIIGAPKCGTTSLAHTLSEHPEVYIPPIKEIGFFANEEYWGKGVEWYASYFEERGTEVKVGEATPYYLQSPKAPRRIFAVCPEARLIAIVRNPVERARSHYWYRRWYGNEHRNVKEAFNEEIEKYPYVENDDYIIPPGLYAKHLKRYTKVFDKERIYVTSLRRLTNHPKKAIQRLQKHIGIEYQDLAISHKNKSSVPRSRSYRDFVWGLVKSQGPLKQLTKACTTRALRHRMLRFIHSINMKEKEKPELPMDVKNDLKEIYKTEINKINAKFGVNIHLNR